MGYYTRLSLKIRLRHDTPIEVTSFLTAVIVDYQTDVPTGPGFDHPFFSCQRWLMLFLANNFDCDMPRSTISRPGPSWRLTIDSEFKNRDDEIEKFLDWIKPYIAGRKKKTYLGWSKGETADWQWHYRVDCSDSERRIF